jgi:hypothetical protein
LQSFRGGNRLPTLTIDGAEILQNFRRIHSALAQLFFHERKVVTNEIQIKHSAFTLAEKLDSVRAYGSKSLTAEDAEGADKNGPKRSAPSASSAVRFLSPVN